MVIFLYLLKSELQLELNAWFCVCIGFVSFFFLIYFPASRQIVDMPDSPAACGQMLEATFSAVTHSVMIFTIQESCASTLVCSSKLDETLASLMISKSVGNKHVFRISGRL